jgi:signal transduction histidine kinase
MSKIPIILADSPAWQNNVLVISIAIVCMVFVVWVATIVFRGSQRNEKLKYEFIMIIAHKYRTPLTQVKWLCERLLLDEKDSFKRESLTDIQFANENLIKLTNSLLEITDDDKGALSSYSFEKIPIYSLVRETAEPFKVLFHKKNIFFSVECDPNLDVKCKVDRKRIEFVLQSLFDNARIYSPMGKDVRVLINKSFHKVIISVIDNGIGISKEELPNIFSKFFRSDSALSADTEGFGISLFLSQAIVRRHRGKLKVSSPGLGQGARFDLILKATK